MTADIKLRNLLTRYDAWREQREQLAADEDAGIARASDWQESDDIAVSLLEKMAGWIRSHPEIADTKGNDK